MKAKIQWSTPDIDQQILYIARVSNPENQSSGKTGLLRYLMEHGHVSPFEMANVCMEIETTRDIGRQILRHRSFSFQEFSQRYASAHLLEHPQPRQARMQDHLNRQNSIPNVDQELAKWWDQVQSWVIKETDRLYAEAMKQGIAKEQARVLLPEGLTSSRMYMNGTLRSWIHYLKQRLDPTTQAEHRQLAGLILAELRTVAPITLDAFFPVDVASDSAVRSA
jgi:thymidylate synthase (FAD)